MLDPLLARLIRRAYHAGHGSLHLMPLEQIRAYLERLDNLSGNAPPFEEYKPLESVHFIIQRPMLNACQTVLFLRPSAFTGGGIDSSLVYTDMLCNQLQMNIITLLFRVAPEFRFPIYFEDIVASTEWIGENHNTLGLHADFIYWGESSGGTMAASACQYFAQKKVNFILAQVLVYPMVDLINSYPSKQQYGAGFMLDLPFIEWLKNKTLKDPKEAYDYRASPGLTDDLSGLPPAFILTAECDPLRDEAEHYAKQLQHAGNLVFTYRQPGVIHSFLRYYDKLLGAQQSLAWLVDSLKNFLRDTDHFSQE